MTLKGRDFLSISDLSGDEIRLLVKETGRMKSKQREGGLEKVLEDHVIGLLFEKPSTRTRVSFQVAINHLGGNAVYMRPGELHLSRGEAIKDTARILSSYLDGIVVRTYSQRILEELAEYSDVPVINALSDLEHPTQIISDLYSMLEAKKKIDGLRLAWIGDGNNVCHSLLLACGKLGLDLNVSCPEGYDPKEEILTEAKSYASESRAEIKIVREPKEAIRDVDVIYTDTWVSIGQEEEYAVREKAFRNYQINRELLSQARDDVIVMHCLPAYRGKEITEDVLEGDKSIVWEQSRNKLYGAKAILASFIP